MASSAIGSVQAAGIGEILSGLLHSDGSADHRFVRKLHHGLGIEAGRSLTDIMHHLSGLHGRHPGLCDTVAARAMHPSIQDWITAAVDGFSRERVYLTRVVVAAGPLPSTPGHAQSEAAVMGQQRAIEMLAQSDRTGCALGAAIAQVLEWRAMRGLIDTAARRFGIEPRTLLIPTREETIAAARQAAVSLGIERAIAFGAQQVLAQHRGLWDLLEARELARRTV